MKNLKLLKHVYSTSIFSAALGERADHVQVHEGPQDGGVARHPGRRLRGGLPHLGPRQVLALLVLQQQGGLPRGGEGLHPGREPLVLPYLPHPPGGRGVPQGERD